MLGLACLRPWARSTAWAFRLWGKIVWWAVFLPGRANVWLHTASGCRGIIPPILRHEGGANTPLGRRSSTYLFFDEKYENIFEMDWFWIYTEKMLQKYCEKHLFLLISKNMFFGMIFLSCYKTAKKPPFFKTPKMNVFVFFLHINSKSINFN